MSESLKAVSSGFRLVYIGLMLVVLAVVINLVANMVLGRGGAGQGLELLVNGLNLLGTIVGLVGRFKCMAVPRQAGSARQMIVISVALEIVSLLIALMFLVNNLEPFLPLEVLVTGGLGVLVMEITATILFLLFTRETATFVRRRDLAATAMSVMWLWVTTLILFVVAFAIMFGSLIAAMRGGAGAGVGANGNAAGVACVGAILMLVGLVVGLVTLIRYSNLLIAMSNATLAFSRRGFEYEDEDEYDDDYEDDRPRRRGRRDEDDEYEDGEEDDRPRRR